MKSYLKITLFSAIVVLTIFISSQTSAIIQAYTYTPASSSYTDISDTFSYSENVVGNNKGFNIKRTSTIPRSEVIKGCDYYDWTSNFRKCKQTAKYKGYTEDNLKKSYNMDRPISEAFRTYQQSSRQQYQLEIQNANSRHQYNGYGYGYQIYRWGW